MEMEASVHVVFRTLSRLNVDPEIIKLFFFFTVKFENQYYFIERDFALHFELSLTSMGTILYSSYTPT